MYEMKTQEPESDAARWGLDIFDVDQFFSSNYYDDSKQHDVEIFNQNYSGDSHYETEYSDLDNNDYNNTHVLDEELMQLSIAGASESSVAVEEYQDNTDVHLDWHSPVRNCYKEFADHKPGLEELGDGGASSSCSSPGDRLHDGEEYSYTLEITDESDLDGEVGKRLNQLISVPHIPRINGDIPSFDEATSDHQRLLDRLQLYELVEHKTEGDGNCQFRALSDQFYRTQEHHKFVRKQVVNQLKAHPEIYEGYVPMAYGDYLKRMVKSGEWGDHVTLQAAADSYGVKILVITSFKDTCYIEILPKNQKSKRVIYLSFWAEVHYNSIYPWGDMPPCDMDTKKKKKWWNFRNKQ